MDPLVIVVAIVILMPLAVLGSLAVSARMRGPLARKESRRPVGPLVTDAVPEEHPDPDAEQEMGPPDFAIDSEPPEADPGLRPS